MTSTTPASVIDATTLKERLLASGIARPQDIAGCPDEEIARLEGRYGRFPDSYRAILGLIGHRAGRLVDDQEFQIFADQLDAVNATARETLADYAEDGIDPGIPPNAFFILDRYGDCLHYLLTGEAADSAVWWFKADEGEIERIQPSVWAWLEAFVKDAEAFIRRGAAELHARRG